MTGRPIFTANPERVHQIPSELRVSRTLKLAYYYQTHWA